MGWGETLLSWKANLDNVCDDESKRLEARSRVAAASSGASAAIDLMQSQQWQT